MQRMKRSFEAAKERTWWGPHGALEGVRPRVQSPNEDPTGDPPHGGTPGRPGLTPSPPFERLPSCGDHKILIPIKMYFSNVEKYISARFELLITKAIIAANKSTNPLAASNLKNHLNGLEIF